MQNIKSLRTYLLKIKGVVEDTPFGPETLVFKVMGKMFILVGWDEIPLKVTLKCDPDLALALGAKYHAVGPGYYMNKKHWITVVLDGSIADEEILAMIEASYELVVRGLRKSDQKSLERL
jgi:predicted DNA-binding protein (MmcQ/YjbR family)